MSGLLAVVQAYAGWLALAALGVGVGGLIWLAALQRRVRMVTPDVRRLVREMEGKSIDEVLEGLLGNMEFLGKRVGRLQVVTEELERGLGLTIRHTGLVKYNAEPGLGGELSFALALLDGDENGTVLTSVHTLDECRLYARNIEHGKCARELSDEESTALDIALGRRRPDPRSASRMRRPRWRAKDRAEAGRDKPVGKRGEGNAE